MSDLKSGINSTYESVRSESPDLWTSYPNGIVRDELREKLIKSPKLKLYKARYLMLFLYSMCTLLNGFQWIQYAIIASIVTCYYNVSVSTTNLTSILFMVMFMPFVIPVAWVMDNKGMKATLVIAAAGNTLGACLQCFSLTPERFYVVLLTQTVLSISQVFSVSAPAYVAALWFPASSVSTACAVGILSNQLGIALGFVIPPVLVPNDCTDVVDVEVGLRNLAVGQAVINFLVFFFIVILYRDKPPSPPSFAEANKPLDSKATLKSIRKMFGNLNFNLLLASVGLSGSVYFAILTMLNQMVVRAFPGQEVTAGWMGAENIIAGVVGSVISGYILDKYNTYRATSIVFYTASVICLLVYTAVFTVKKIWIYFVMIGAIGFTMAGYFPIGYQLAAEITYPESEGTSTTLLVASVSFFGIPVTMIASYLQQTYSDLYSNIFFCVCAVVGYILSVFIKCNNNRSSEERSCLKQMEEPA